MGVEMLSIKRCMAVKLETVAGTPETLADADFDMRLRNIDFTPDIPVDDEGSKYQNGNHAEDESIHGAQSVSIKCSSRMYWGGAVATPPDWWKLAKICGSGVVSYTTVGRGLVGRQAYDDQTGTIWIQDTQIGTSGGPVTTLYKFAGCMGNMTIHADKPGDPWVVDFEIKGRLVDVVDGTALVLTGPSTELREIFLSNTFTIGGVAKKISKFSFTTGNTVSPLQNQADATGYSHFVISRRQPRFSCDPLAVKQATDDWLNTMLTEGTGPIILTSAAATPHFTLKIVDAQLLSNAMASREGLVAWEQNYKALMNGPAAGSLIDSALTYEDTWELLQGAKA